MAKYPTTKRLRARIAGRSADERDIARTLRRALSRWPDTGDLPPAQPIAQRMGPSAFARWRTRQIQTMPGLTLAEQHPDMWQLVLFVMKPSSVPGFLRTGRTTDLLSPPTVGQFPSAVESEHALAATLAGWIDQFEGRPHRLAPPVLQDHTGARIVNLGIGWALPATEVIAAPYAAFRSTPASVCRRRAW